MQYEACAAMPHTALITPDHGLELLVRVIQPVVPHVSPCQCFAHLKQQRKGRNKTRGGAPNLHTSRGKSDTKPTGQGIQLGDWEYKPNNCRDLKAY